MQVQLAVMVFVEFIVTVVFMVVTLATPPVQLFQVLQLALYEAFTLITVFCGMLFQVLDVPPTAVP